jgi:hypothetical protein
VWFGQCLSGLANNNRLGGVALYGLGQYRNEIFKGIVHVVAPTFQTLL